MIRIVKLNASESTLYSRVVRRRWELLKAAGQRKLVARSSRLQLRAAATRAFAPPRVLSVEPLIGIIMNRRTCVQGAQPTELGVVMVLVLKTARDAL